MLKRLLMLVTAFGLSLPAVAGYLQYDFENVVFSDGAVVTGTFYQDTADRAILAYRFNINGANGPSMTTLASGHFANLYGTSNGFAGAGPTSFSGYDDLSDAYFQQYGFVFAATGQAGLYAVSGWNNWTAAAGIDQDLLTYLPGSRSITAGFVRASAVPPELWGWLSQRPVDGIVNNVPAPAAVPLPGVAWLMLAALGALMLTRRAARL